MGQIAQWGPKKFVLSPTQIVVPTAFATTVELKSDSQNDTSGTAPTNTRGILPRPVSISVPYAKAAGVDPRAELEEWENLVGVSHPLYIGSKQFGKNSLLLKKVDSTEFVFSPNGDILSVLVNLSLEEPTSAKTSSGSGSGSGAGSSAGRTPSVYNETVEKRRAMNATAPASDRSNKKPSTAKTEVSL